MVSAAQTTVTDWPFAELKGQSRSGRGIPPVCDRQGDRNKTGRRQVGTTVLFSFTFCPPPPPPPPPPPRPQKKEEVIFLFFFSFFIISFLVFQTRYDGQIGRVTDPFVTDTVSGTGSFKQCFRYSGSLHKRYFHFTFQFRPAAHKKHHHHPPSTDTPPSDPVAIEKLLDDLRKSRGLHSVSQCLRVYAFVGGTTVKPRESWPDTGKKKQKRHQKCRSSTVCGVHAALIVGFPSFVKASVLCRLPN